MTTPPPPGNGPDGGPSGYYPVNYGRPVRPPHPHPNLRALGILQIVVSGVGALVWLVASYSVAFCTGVDTARCRDVTSLYWLPTMLTAVCAVAGVTVTLRSRRTNSTLERRALVVLALLTTAAMIWALAWYYPRASAAPPPA